MKKNKLVTVVVTLILGILIGKYFFANQTTEKPSQNKEVKATRWTCSMHPKIDMPEFGACPICGMDLIPKGDEDSTDLSDTSFQMSKNAMALANIETLIVGGSQQGEQGNSIELSGTIKANDKASAIQTAHFGGRIERLNYKTVGEYVSKGSLIATVYSPALVTAQNEFIEALEIKNIQPELYNAVRNKLKNWKISEKQILQIERTKKVITNFNMYANVSGYIDEMLVQEGNHVKEGSPLFKVSNLSSVWAVFDVYEKDIQFLKRGQEITIKLNAFPNHKIKTKIDYIDPNLNSNTRTVAVRTTLNNKNNKLKPGMFVSSAVELKNNNNESSTILVPKTAVLWTGKRSVVYVKVDKEKPIFEIRDVELDNASGDNYVINSGLKTEDEVVVNGAFTVDAAAQLQGKRSMMTSSAKNTEPTNEQQESISNIEVINVSPKFKKPFNELVSSYIQLKDAFVDSDSESVQKLATQTLKLAKKVPMNYLKNKEAHKRWMETLPKLKEGLQSISATTDIEKQRNQFVMISNAFKPSIAIFGADKTVYIQHCPMANSNKGADWLSFDAEIKNPYFGDKMLKCGSTTQTVTKATKK